MSPLLGLFCLYLPLANEVTLIANQKHQNLVVAVLLDVFKPAFDRLERLILRDVVDEDTADSASVVGSSHGLERFLASRVPDLQLYVDISVNWDDSGREFDAYG